MRTVLTAFFPLNYVHWWVKLPTVCHFSKALISQRKGG